MGKKKKSWIKVLIGIGLILFAVIPTPDDVTVISPVVSLVYGIKLINDGLK